MTKEEIRIFEALFKGVSTRFGLRTIEKYFENPDFLFCHSFQNLRLGSIYFGRIAKSVNHQSVWETTFPQNTHAGFCK